VTRRSNRETRIQQNQTRLDEEERPATWWHWFIEWCPKCEQNISQGPIAEIIGEDCVLFDRIDRYKAAQQQEDACRCSHCGTKAVPRYRHGIADNNVTTDANGVVEKKPLLQGQRQGTFLKAIEYDLIKAGLMLMPEEMKK